jgi:DNA-binding NarL/FixJ family response regulator
MYIPTQAYLFALYIFGLICLVAVLCRILFFNAKRQNALLDEKEEKMLKLYQSIETIAEEFEDQVKEALDEIKEVENRTIKVVAQLKAQDTAIREAAAAAAAAAVAALPEEETTYKEPMRINGSKTKTVDSTRFKAASEVLERAERMVIGGKPKNSETRVRSVNGLEFQRIIDETVTDQYPPQPELSEKQKRTNDVLALSAEGKTVTQIARELGITRNEVTLVIELGGKENKSK